MQSELLLLIGISFSLGFTPGPNNAVASFSGFNFGIKKTIPLILGVGFGYTVLVILINFLSFSMTNWVFNLNAFWVTEFVKIMIWFVVQ